MIKTKNQKYLNYWNAVILAVLFLICYIPFMTVQNLITNLDQVNGFGSLGFTLLAILYLFQMVGSIFGASVVQKMGLKMTFSLGFVSFSFMVFFQILPSLRAKMKEDGKDLDAQFYTKKNFQVAFLIAGQVITGLAQAVIWVAQGEYVSLCAPAEYQGYYFGLFWSIYMSSQIIGNAIGSYIITKVAGPSFFLYMGIIMLVGAFLFIFQKRPHLFQNESREDDVETEQEPTFMELTKNTIKIMFSGKMMRFNMQIFFTGISIAFWSGILTPIMVFQLNQDPDYNLSDNEMESKALMAMVAFGFGEVTGGIAQGQFIDKFKAKKATIFNLIVIIIMTAVTILSIMSEKYGYLTFLMTFCWGFQDGVFNIHTFTTLGFEFETQSEPFGVFNLNQGIAVFIFQLLQGKIDQKSKMQLIIYSIICGALGMIACLSSYTFPYKQSDKLKSAEVSAKERDDLVHKFLVEESPQQIEEETHQTKSDQKMESNLSFANVNKTRSSVGLSGVPSERSSMGPSFVGSLTPIQQNSYASQIPQNTNDQNVPNYYIGQENPIMANMLPDQKYNSSVDQNKQ